MDQRRSIASGAEIHWTLLTNLSVRMLTSQDYHEELRMRPCPRLRLGAANHFSSRSARSYRK
jgi:hypothetical protein